MDVLGDHLDLADLGRAALARASTSSSTSHSGAEAPELTPTVSTPSNQAGSTAEARRGLAGGPGDLDQPDRVGGVRPRSPAPAGSPGQGLDRGLPVLGGVADVVGAGAGQHREPLAKGADDPGGLVDRQGGLGEVGDPLGVGDLDRGRLVLVADEVDGPGAWPMVPATSSCPSWPMSTMS